MDRTSFHFATAFFNPGDVETVPLGRPPPPPPSSKVLELTAEEMDALDEDELLAAMSSIDVLIAELVKSPKDLWNSITASYSDLYLNRCYILAMRARIPKVRGGREAQLGPHSTGIWR